MKSNKDTLYIYMLIHVLELPRFTNSWLHSIYTFKIFQVRCCFILKLISINAKKIERKQTILILSKWQLRLALQKWIHIDLTMRNILSYQSSVSSKYETCTDSTFYNYPHRLEPRSGIHTHFCRGFRRWTLPFIHYVSSLKESRVELITQKLRATNQQNLPKTLISIWNMFCGMWDVQMIFFSSNEW